ncbi:MAG: hypothetical protein HY720_24070 [Planctomycetes bacterium]|nr:hypothetical protein [Planctomycetota bacterium]
MAKFVARAIGIGLVLALGGARGQEALEFRAPAWGPGTSVVAALEGKVEYAFLKSGGEAEAEENSGEETWQRKIRFRLLDPDTEGRARIELVYLEDGVESVAGKTSLAGRTVVATRGEAFSLEVTAGEPLGEVERHQALADAARFLAPDVHQGLFPDRPVSAGDSWKTLPEAARAILGDVGPAAEAKGEATFAGVETEGGREIAVFAFQVSAEGEEKGDADSSKTDAWAQGEIRVEIATGRILSWDSTGRSEEEDRVRGEEGPEIVLRSERDERSSCRYEYAQGSSGNR